MDTTVRKEVVEKLSNHLFSEITKYSKENKVNTYEALIALSMVAYGIQQLVKEAMPYLRPKT